MEEKITVTDAAKILGVTRKVIYRLARDGKLKIERVKPVYAKHGPVRVSRAQVEAIAKGP